jgi:hypothetical protein
VRAEIALHQVGENQGRILREGGPYFSNGRDCSHNNTDYTMGQATLSSEFPCYRNAAEKSNGFEGHPGPRP